MPSPRRGTLILVMGPSGAGKDTLIEGARQHFSGDARFHFPRRIITRAANAPGERHLALDESAFSRLRSAGGLALSWQAHRLSYGLPASIEAELAGGRHVVANVSRQVIAEAERRFAPVGVILVTASPATLAWRLAERGRETADQIAERLSSSATHDDLSRRAITIANDGSIQLGIASFVAAIERLAQVSSEQQG